jgi:glutamate 5-kinase
LDGHLLGKGIVNYSDLNLLKVKGKSTFFSKAILKMDRAEVIHRDHWVSLYVEDKKEV